MSTFDWFLVGWWILSAFVTVATIGKPRKTLEPVTGAITVLVFAALIAGLFISRGVL